MGSKDLSDAQLLLAKVINGGLAGVTGVTANFPLDLSKTRLQAQVVKPGEERLYKNVFQTIRVIKAKEGFAGLYAGYYANLYFIVFEKALKLCANDHFRQTFANKDTGHVSLQAGMAAGALAGTIQSVVTTPMELLKIEGQQASARGDTSYTFNRALKLRFQSEGIRGFYRGWVSTVIRDCPWSVMYFPAYAAMRDTALFGSGENFTGNLLAGMIAGAAASGLCTPLDVIKTRLQNRTAAQGKISYGSCAQSIWQKEGGAAFFKGAVPRMICVSVLMGVAQGFYEMGIGESIVRKVC